MDIQLASGFDRGLEAEIIQVVDYCKVCGVTFLLIEFIGAEEPEWVNGLVGFEKIPQMVMDFFEDVVILTVWADEA